MLSRRRTLVLASSAALPAIAGAPAAARAAGDDVTHLVNQSAETARAILYGGTTAAARDDLKRAYGVLIIPLMIKAGLVIGGEAGDGVLLSQDRNGAWSGPAFYRLVSGSVGLQIGFEQREVMLLVMTEKGLNSLMTNQIKLGADASITAGNMGTGREVASGGSLGADFLAYSRAVGIFGGGALEGGVIQPLPDLNRRFYGRAVTPKEIVIERTVDSPAAAKLKSQLSPGS
jgi:lipid-binding SYLF domain-containing protein